MSAYAREYQRSLTDPDGFWLDAARRIAWVGEPRTASEPYADGLARWFPDGRLNTSHNALDRHVDEGRGDQLALIYASPVTESEATYTYRELTRAVAVAAGALRRIGIDRRDRVLIYMPMIPEAVVAMLACARIGAIHSVVFGGFAAQEVSARIDDFEPGVILTASCGVEPTRTVAYLPIIDEALSRSRHVPRTRVVLQRPQCPAELAPNDLDWDDFLASADPVDPVPVAAGDPLYVLYTSGTTGKPKGIVRDNGGHAVALDWSMRNIYAAGPGDVYWAASDIGWVVGHSYIVYGPLIAGCTTVLFEGKPVGTPDAGAFWRAIDRYRVNTMFTAPTAIRAIKQVDPEGEMLGGFDLSSLRSLFLAGERTDPDTYRWISGLLGVPVIDHWWQTETGWPITATCLGLGELPGDTGTAGRPVPGYELRVLDAEHGELPANEDGAIAIGLPLPPGVSVELWGGEGDFASSYLSEHPGFYTSGDGGSIDADGQVRVMGRVDDVINVAGHRLSTGAIEGAISSHPQVAECAVIGVPDPVKGRLPLACVVLKAGSGPDAEGLEGELQQLVRTEIGAIAALKRAIAVEKLPKTRSGKVLRGTMRAIAEGRSYRTPATIEDPAALELIEDHISKEVRT